MDKLKSGIVRGLIAIFALAACGQDAQPDKHLIDRLTIDHGVFGQLFRGCDTGGCNTSLCRLCELTIFDGSIASIGAGVSNPTPTLTTTTDNRGAYEVELGAGDYVLVTSETYGEDGAVFFHTAPVDVEVNDDLTRCDWTSGIGGGFWECESASE